MGRNSLVQFAVCIIAAVCGCSHQSAPPLSGPTSTAPASAAIRIEPGAVSRDTTAENKPRTIDLVIDYGDGAEKRIGDIPWKESMTVLDVLQAARNHSHGISFSSRGSGETLMVTKVDDVTNQGGATSDKNWIFRINGRMGDESCALAKVRPGDTVLWKFGPYE